ncbi:metallophosphoesterase [Marinilabiliaceae bacterium ANBcel2]|nr:metallophosphoesterase [Marinilabiliaceae bacterium ANBcel2]
MFFIIVLAIHTAVNFYIALRGWQALELNSGVRPWFITFMVLLYVAYPLARILEKIWYHPIPITLHWIGAFWFAAMLYVTLLLFLTDIIRVINHFTPFIHNITENIATLKMKLFYAFSLITLLVVVAGHINAWTPKTTRLDIVIPKKAGNMESLRIVAASDIHLGTLIGPRKTQKLVNQINALEPDIVLFAGDVIDEDVETVVKQDLGNCLKQINAPLGVYASTGNHEYIGGAEPAVKYLEQHNINVIRDSALLINNNFYIIGREDLHKRFTTGKSRKELNKIVADVDMSRPLILLDHQPYNLNDAIDAKIDLQISGHTHHGQLWPFGYITNQIFEVSRGYAKFDNTHIYVSPGYGTWGPPVRTGNRPEIVMIQLYFDQPK